MEEFYAYPSLLLDVRSPLKRRKRIRLATKNRASVSFEYESLGTFCFICGLLGHSDRFCRQLFQSSGAISAKE